MAGYPIQMNDQMNPDGSGGLAGGVGGDFWSQFPTSGPGAPTYQQPSTSMGMPPISAPGPSTGGGDYQSEFLQAAQELGISPQQFRGNPAVMDRVTQYLSQKYPGQQWANGGARAGDWVSVNGQGFDVLPAGDRNWQWLNDPANSTAGSGGGGLTGSIGMGAIPADIVNSIPGYQFAVNQAQKAIERGAAAKGTLLTGGLQEQLGLDIGQGLALPAYQMEVGNLYNLAGLGAGAASDTGRFLSGYANNAGGAFGDIGNAQSAGTVGAGNAWANTIAGITNAVSKYPWGQPKAPTVPNDPAAGVR